MNVALRKRMTLDEFLAWEERQELRYEFDGFQPVAMVGSTAAHSTIQRNLLFALTGRLRGKPCQPHGSDLKIHVAGCIRYPDAFVVCKPIPPRDTVVDEPRIVFEILSPSTTNKDLVQKNQEYRETRSIERYVVLEQSHAAAIMFSRKGEDWVSEVAAGSDAALSLPEIGIALPLSEIYEGVELDSDDPEELAV